MLQLPVWDASDPINHIPLKGKHMDEFLLSLDAGAEMQQKFFDFANKIHAAAKDKAREKGIQEDLEYLENIDGAVDPMAAMCHRVTQAIRAKLSKPGVKEFGLDRRDMETIILSVVSAPQFDTASAIDEGMAANQAMLEAPSLETGKIAMASGESAMAAYFLQMYSACLARQENKSAEYRKLIDRSHAEIHKHLQRMALDINSQVCENPEVANTMKLNFAGTYMVLMATQTAREKDLPLREFYEDAAFGTDYRKTAKMGGMVESVRDMVATALDIDRTTQTGEIRIKQMERDFLNGVAKKNGETLLSVPDQQGRRSAGA